MLVNLSIERAIAMLIAIKVFKGYSAKSLRIIAGTCLWHRHEEGQDIVGYHDSTTGVFFIVQGEIRIKHYVQNPHCFLQRGWLK